MNKDYIDEDPFIHKGEGVPAESLNNFILLGGLLEGSINVTVPEHFINKIWSIDETPQRARFCKFTLSNMTGTNNKSNLTFNNSQHAIIKVEIFMQMLDVIKKLKLVGTNLGSLTINILKKYPTASDADFIKKNFNFNTDLNLFDNQLQNDVFYIELIAKTNNITIQNLSLTIKTKKLSGDPDLSINGNQIYINDDRSNTLPIYTKNEFQDLFDKYVKRDLETVEEATAYLEASETPDGAIVLLPKEAFD
ncbi:MAG: hypothetical protein LBU40_00275 [Methanobrevibacter sp.]|jgi:hypothetical protein|nr:hypothetical protein [Methanobrevibacter sp.]